MHTQVHARRRGSCALGRVIIIFFQPKNLPIVFFGVIYIYKSGGKLKKMIFLVLPTFFWPTNFPGPLYKSKFLLFCLWASWYSKRPAWAHGFNAKNGFEKNASGPEILAKKSQNNEVWYGDLNFGTFSPISWDPMRFFQNRFLRWNRELKPVVLSTMKPINGTNFFLTYKGVQANLSVKKK